MPGQQGTKTPHAEEQLSPRATTTGAWATSGGPQRPQMTAKMLSVAYDRQNEGQSQSQFLHAQALSGDIEHREATLADTQEDVWSLKHTFSKCYFRNTRTLSLSVKNDHRRNLKNPANNVLSSREDVFELRKTTSRYRADLTFQKLILLF